MEQSKPRPVADSSAESCGKLPGGPSGPRQGPGQVDPRLNAALTALDYSQRCLDASSLDALCFLLTNDSRAVAGFDRCSLITHLGGKSSLRAVNGQPILEKKSAFHAEISALAPILKYLTRGLLLPINESTDIPAEKDLNQEVIQAMEAVRSYGESSGAVFVAVLPLKHEKEILGHLLVEFFEGTAINRIGIDLFMRLGPSFAAALAEAWILEKRPRVRVLIETSAEPARGRTIRTARRYGLAAAIMALLLVVFFLPISATVGGEAQVVPRDRRIAFSKVGGLIDRIFVKEGDQVREGQVLASLDPKELDYKIASAKAELDVLSEKAALYRSYLDEDPAKLAESRLVELRIKAARLDLQYHQWQRQFLEIKAPCTGVILTKDVQTFEGKKLTKGEPFCEIAVPGELWVDVSVPEDRVANVRPGNRLRLYLNNEPLRAHDLTVAEITPSAETDPRLGNVYRVKASFADGQESARVGMKGIGKIDTGDTTLWSITTQRFARLWNRWSLWFSDIGVDHEAAVPDAEPTLLYSTGEACYAHPVVPGFRRGTHIQRLRRHNHGDHSPRPQAGPGSSYPAALPPLPGTVSTRSQALPGNADPAALPPFRGTDSPLSTRVSGRISLQSDGNTAAAFQWPELINHTNTQKELWRMKRLKNWLNKWRTQEPEKSYIRPITGEVEVTRREFLMEQLEERIVLHVEGTDYALDYEPLEFYGEKWYEVYLPSYWNRLELDEAPGRKYTPCGDHNEIIYGSDFNDIIDCSGSSKRYIILGLGGADTIIGGEGDDYIYGYDSVDWRWLYHKPLLDDTDTLGGNTKEQLIGNGGNDWIWGGPGDDFIVGDYLDGGGTCRDRLYGEEGDDVLFGDGRSGAGSGSDRLSGGPGNDILFGDSADGEGYGYDTLFGGKDNDVLYGDTARGIGYGIDELWGGKGDDIIYGDSLSDVGYGKDTIYGGPDEDEIYGDSLSGAGYGDDEIRGGEGNDRIYADSLLAVGSGSDLIYGESGNDVIFADSVQETGTGNDMISGGEGADLIYGDSRDEDGSGDDIIQGGPGEDQLFGDTVEGVGTGDDWIDGGPDNDIVFGDSVNSDGTGSDLVYGGQGDDTLFGDSRNGSGSGCDVLNSGEGYDMIFGDGTGAGSSGNDTLYIYCGSDTVHGYGQSGDTLVLVEQGSDGFTCEVTGERTEYRVDAETGELMGFNRQFGRWDTIGERYWDEELNAWVENRGQYITVDYATKTIRYDNFATDMWILEDGAWVPFNPDDHYVVDYCEDPETGMLLVYNNDLGTWDPYMEEYNPAGADYLVVNESDMVYYYYNDSYGTQVCLENYGEGAYISTEGTGGSWIQAPGDRLYWDSETGLWWSFGWGKWSYSLTGGATWQEAPNLRIQLVDDQGGGHEVGFFDGHEWSVQQGSLEFLDTNYAPSGWHDMLVFYDGRYDGKNYDGEPLIMSAQWLGDGMPEGMSVPPSGNEPDQPPEQGDKVYKWFIDIYGAWTDSVKASFIMFHPDENYDWRPWSDTDLNVTFQADDTLDCFEPDFIRHPGVINWIDPPGPERLLMRPTAIGEHGLYHEYHRYGYSIEEMVEDLQMLQWCFAGAAGKKVEAFQVENLVILNHGPRAYNLEYALDPENPVDLGRMESKSTPSFRLGATQITKDNLCEKFQDDEGHEYNYKGVLRELNALMIDGGQIQHYGCNTVGPNPGEGYTPPDWRMQETEYRIDWKYRAYVSRSILATIAHLTDTTVFASSDYQKITLNRDAPQGASTNGGPIDLYLPKSEMCLEFGVNKDGYQVQWSELNQEVWAKYTWWTKEDRKSDVQLVDHKECVLHLDTDHCPPPAPTGRDDESPGTKYLFLPGC